MNNHAALWDAATAVGALLDHAPEPTSARPRSPAATRCSSALVVDVVEPVRAGDAFGGDISRSGSRGDPLRAGHKRAARTLGLVPPHPGPLPHVRFVATGGLDASNVEEFLDVGVPVAAVGSALEDASQPERLAAVLRSRDRPTRA